MSTEIEITLNGIEAVKEFVNITSKFTSEIDAISERYIVDSKSILGMFSINLLQSFIVKIHSDDSEEIFKFNKEMEKFKV